MTEEKAENNLEKSSGRAADAAGSAIKEAAKGMPDLIEKQREDQAYQKSENRPPGDTSRLLGKSPALLEALKAAQGEKNELTARQPAAHSVPEKHSEADTSTLVDAAGNKRITQTNGDIRQENKDGTGYERKHQPDGTVNERHWGPTAQDSYVLSKQPDGSWKGSDSAGNKHTKWDDGSERIERPAPDKRSCTRIPDGHGGFKELYAGPRPEARFQLTKHADGRTEFSEIGDKPHQPINDPKVEAERNRLNDLAERKITDPTELAKFRVDMARFEDRSKQLEDNYQKEGLSPAEATKKAHEEIAKTYSQMSRLLEANDNPQIPLDSKRRVEIAEQVMSQAATPTSIDQGQHRTCNVTVVEMRTYSRSPSEAAKLVADVATTGEYVTKNGTKVTLVPGDLAPHDEAKTNPPLDGGRSLASQLFQVTAVNISYQKENSDLRYRQREKDPAAPGDTGERLVDYSTKPPQNVGQRPALSDDQIVNIGNEITGKNEKDWFIDHSKYRGNNTVKVDSEQDLQDKIAEAKAQGKLPVVIGVHTGNEPFLTDSGAGAAGVGSVQYDTPSRRQLLHAMNA
jgi:hypothetical protein